MSRRDEWIERLKGELDQLNQHLDELEQKASELSGEAKTKVDVQISHLREMVQPAQDKLGEVRAAGEERWDKLAAEAEKVQKALVHSYNYFKSQL